MAPLTIVEKRRWLFLLMLATPTISSAMVIERSSSERNRKKASFGQTSKNENWYNKRRNQGIKVSRRGPKPPQWEKEGDTLYQEIIQDNPYRTTDNQKMTTIQAQNLLSDKLKQKEQIKDGDSSPIKETSIAEEPPYLWGGLSVGPVWKQRLVQAGFSQPTPIQVAAFTPIIGLKENLILASATGSGKSLAYLLPLLTTRQEELMGRVWIFTPTTELALQLQRMVSTLLGGDDKSDSSPNKQVVQVVSSRTASNDDDMPLVSSLVGSSSYMLAGTARTFQQLLEEMNQPVIVDKQLRQTTKSLLSNMEVLIFDEADRLFQTEAVARDDQERRMRKVAADETPNNTNKKARRIPLPTPLALQVLESISNRLRFHQRTYQYSTMSNRQSSSPSSQFKIICASATVGRTLRRQLMEALQVPSMDKAAALITADVRTKKDAAARKTSLLPSTLQHAYSLLPEDCDQTSPAAIVTSMIDTLHKELEPAPTLIFPGRNGVASVQSELVAHGFERVYGLEDVGQVLDSNPTGEHHWRCTPIFVVSEKLGRGLDIPQLGYVVMLQVPSSAAGYTHLAGRTGRNGRLGTAVTFCRPREVPKLVVIAETLGLNGLFCDLDGDKSKC